MTFIPTKPDAEDSQFPIPFITEYRPVVLDPSNPKLSDEQRKSLKANIELWRDAMILFTATGNARGVAGHTGGPFDSVPEVCILLGILAADSNGEKYFPTLFDEAGHRVPIQYMLAAFRGRIPAHHLLNYRAAYSGLPGHPELHHPSADFSSGRLGHMWPFVNGVALAQGKIVFCLGSDGAQQEGSDVEAARLAVKLKLNVKLIIDDNNMTVCGPSLECLPDYSIGRTLSAEGMAVFEADGEDLDATYAAIAKAITHQGPAAVILHRPICPGIPILEGSRHGHDAISVSHAVKYLKSKGYGNEITDIISSMTAAKDPRVYKGSSEERAGNRYVFGKAVNKCLDVIGPVEAAKRVVVIDSDLEHSTGLAFIHEAHPEVFHSSGIMERANISCAAGFGFNNDKQGIFATFTAFSEMCLSEITMARLNNANLLCHFSHSGCDEMADNTCHFGVNGFFLDNGLIESYETRLYFPADAAQMMAIVERIFWDKGLRTVFSTRAKVPYILKENSTERLYESPDYVFQPGKDEVIRTGSLGTVVSYGDMLYRSLDAVTTLRAEGFDIGLINKVTLNVIDEDSMRELGSKGFVLVVESWNQKTGLGSKMGTWLLERGMGPKYSYMGTHREGSGGIWEQIPHQGLGPEHIVEKLRHLVKAHA